MDKDEMDIENSSYTLKGSSETLLPIQLFEFKAHLLEVVEELRIGRVTDYTLAKIQYEDQINKILMEKQELMWKYESVSNQEEIVEKKHNDSLAALKKQLQAKMCLIEEEKGRFQLTAETKERENISLREDIKTLQIAKYNLQKKVQEMEQKLQLHILAKEDHIKQLNECKKCIGNVTQQFGMIKEVHEKLEQTVQAAIQNNKKLNNEINKRNIELQHLKEELKRLSSDFLNYKGTYKQKIDEENISLSEKEQHVKELEERLQAETEINKKLMEVNTSMKEGKQEDVRALCTMQTIVQRHTQTIISLENQLSALREDYKTLERDNELQRAKATENEENFLALQSEQQQALSEWKAQKENLEKELALIQALNLQKCNSKSLNKTLETNIQAIEQQNTFNMNIVNCDIENNMTENRSHSDSASNTTDYVGSSDDVSPSLTSNEIQKMDGTRVDIVHKDANSPQHVYTIADKGHLCEEHQDESSLTENKDSYPTVEQSLKESCNGKCTEEILGDSTCMNIIDEYEKSTAKCRTTIQTQAVDESISMQLDNNKPPTVCSEDASQQTHSSHLKPEDDPNIDIYIVMDKPDRTDNDRGVFINETCLKESQLLNQVNEQPTTTDISPTSNNPNRVLWDGNDYHLPVLYRDLSEISTKSGSHDHIQQPEPIERTNEDPLGVSEKTQQVGRESVSSNNTVKDCIDMGTTFNTSVNSTERAERKRKYVGQEANFTSSYSSQCHEENSSFQSALEQYEGCKVQSLQCAEKIDELRVKSLYTDGRESFPMNTGKDPSVEGKIKYDINVNSNLHSNNHNQQIDCTSDSGNVDEEKVCIQENGNVAAGCTALVSNRQSDEKSCIELAAMKMEKSKPDDRCLYSLSNLAKSVFLPESDLKESLKISFSNQTHHIPSRLSGQAVYSTAEHVSMTDHDAEWNAEQAFHHSSSPILATTSQKSNVVEKPNLFPVFTDSTKSYLINQPNTTHTEVTGSNKDNYDISNIQRQITAIEKFLLNNKLNGSRKRKLEDTCSAEE
ncbi:coiled-coil domain-containing protein 73 [Dendropsophus ebraccatus]|uniref:coiled-coil domain-containing protein 73 n=1 Tax=Dendropsophus ebraccatus TaxID=150705 RepID=UPI00383194A8